MTAIIGIGLLPQILGAHYVTGQIFDAYDGYPSNDLTAFLWGENFGVNENITEIVGPLGSSGADNIYLFDCELLPHPCNIGDIIYIKLFNGLNGRTTNASEIHITGAGYDLATSLRMNSIPNITQHAPQNFANLSTYDANLSCLSFDPDGNIKNSSIFSDFSGAFSRSATQDYSGNQILANFSIPVSEGIYKWGCEIQDSLSAINSSRTNYTLTIDRTPPIISSFIKNVSSILYSYNETARLNCTTTDLLTSVERVNIVSTDPNETKTNYTAIFDGINWYADIKINASGLWEFQCTTNDSASNIEYSAILSITATENNIDLWFPSSSITLSNSNPVENENVSIQVKVQNRGTSTAQNVIIGFYFDDPDNGGVQLGKNATYTFLTLQNTTLNNSFQSQIGITNIFIKLDINDSIQESNKSNNKVNTSIFIPAWQYFFGNITLDKLLGSPTKMNISRWFNETNLAGNVFFSDSENLIQWDSLHAIGKNTSDDNSSDDFSEIDTILGMNSYPDNIQTIFTNQPDIPKFTTNFTIHNKNISFVPSINSTNNSNFITGILWDSTKDTNGEFDDSEREDIVFVSRINPQAIGTYGSYDYEIRIPAKLRELNTIDSEKVYFYFDIN